MIICANCGATNTVQGSPICQKCGALLPVGPRKKRIRIPTGSKEEKPEILPSEEKQPIPEKGKKEKKEKEEGGEIKFSVPEGKKKKKKKAKLDLQAIPTEELQAIPMEEKKSVPKKVSEIPKMPKIELPTLKPLPSTTAKQSTKSTKSTSSKKADFMQEITPQPYGGTILSSKETPEKSSSNTLQSIPPIIDPSRGGVQKPVPAESEEFHATVEKQKRLEEDMVEVLGILSKKLDLPKKEEKKPKPEAKKEIKEKIPPANMGEILKQLLTLDLHIEAAAIIKRDGEVVASAISSRISDSLFATIGQNLSMIGTDIIHGLSGGDLKSISIKGTSGILDLAPIDDQESSLVKDMILIIFSHPKVKSGIIAFAVNIIKKQIIDYLGKKK